MIGSAEVLQGHERSVVIVSTVRTGKRLGFITDDKVSFIQIL